MASIVGDLDARQLAGLLGKPKRQSDGSWMCQCPAHDDRKPSLHITDKGDTVLWHCMVGCDQNVVTDLIAARLNNGSGAPIQSSQIKRRVKVKPQTEEWIPITPVPKGTPDPSFKHPKHGAPSATWAYYDEQGALLFHVARFDTKDGKEILPRCWGVVRAGNEERRGWHWRGAARPRPLYGLDLLALRPGLPVILVEGEKCADAGNLHFGAEFTFMTWPGGAAAIKQIDWTPLVGHDVTIWPDADPAGVKAAKAIAAILVELGDTAPPILEPPSDVPKGFDIVDAINGWPIAKVRDFGLGKREPKPKPEDDAAAPIPLGLDGGGRYVYLSQRQQDVTVYTPNEHTEAALLNLASLSYWKSAFPSERRKFDLSIASDALMEAASSKGIFDPTTVRGRGIWEDRGRSVVHCGDHLVVQGTKVALNKLKPSRWIYVQSAQWEVDAKPATTDVAKRILQICKMLLWEDPKSAVLLAGWIAIAPLCGVLRWRPSIWLTGPSGAGKAQPNDTRTLTPQGWRALGSLRIGDQVTTPDNGFGRVTAVYPQGTIPVFKLRFADGRSTRACADHLWKVRIDGMWRLRTTADLIQIKATNCGQARMLAIPLAQPLDIARNNKTELPLHPYIVGVLLGDGHLGMEYKSTHQGSIRITSHDPEIVAKVRSLLPGDIGLFDTHNPHDFRLGDLSRYGRKTRELIKDLRLLGLRSATKFIPHEYLVATVQERQELLQGLMDTDGTAGTKGSMSFCTVSPRLGSDFCYLVRSLGGIAFQAEKKTTGQLAYVISVRFPNRDAVFSLGRKRDRVAAPYQYADSLYLNLESIEPDGTEECSCIAIDHPDRLYVTDGFIVTHNSWIMEHMIEPLLGRTAIHVQGSTSEAGIRQSLHADARPVMFDEAEAEDQRGIERMQSIMQFARSSANDAAQVLKGSISGRVSLYRARTAFCMASVGVALARSADQSRFTVLGLRDTRDQLNPTRHFQGLVAASTGIDEAFGQSIIARTISLLPVMQRNITVFVEAAGAVLRDSRAADQIGTMLAGAHLLGSDRPASPAKAKEWLMRHDWLEVSGRGDKEEHERCFEAIKQVPVSVTINSRERVPSTIGELIGFIFDPAGHPLAPMNVTAEAARRALAEFGVAVATERNPHEFKLTGGIDVIATRNVLLSNRNSRLQAALKGTSNENWGGLVGRIAGAQKAAQPTWIGTGTARYTVIPWISKDDLD